MASQQAPLPQTPQQHQQQQRPVLGLGTGVEVVRFDRPQCHLDSPFRSPWAAKKANCRLPGPTDPSLSQRLGREAIVLSQLNHPGIIGYRGVSIDASGKAVSSLLMQFGGRSLMDLIEERRGDPRIDECEQPFPLEFIVKVLVQCAEALRYLHNEVRLMHGDLKSANILIGDCNGQLVVRLCDFGSALALTGPDLEVSPEDRAEFRGTELWAAPETIQVGASSFGHKADMWSLGMVAYELLSLDVPHGDAFNMLEDTGSLADDVSGAENGRYVVDGEDSLNVSSASFNLELRLSERLGTRPDIAVALTLCRYRERYDPIVQLFNELTSADPVNRPSAMELLDRLGNIGCWTA